MRASIFRAVLGIVAVSAFGCAPEKEPADPAVFKTMTTQQLEKKEAAAPVSKDLNIAGAPGVELWNYQDAQGQLHSYQIQGPQVVAHQRKPEGKEIYLQHWLHLKSLKGKTLVKRELQERSGEKSGEKSAPHTQLHLKEYVWSEAGLTVIYNTTADRVIQVIHYAVH